MSTKHKILVTFALALIGVGIGYYFNNHYELGLCFRDIATNTYDISCARFYGRIGDLLFPVSIALSITLLALAFVPKAIIAWGRFTLIAVPIAVILFATTPQSNSGGLSGNVGFGPTASEMYVWVSVLYAVISLIIIGRTAIKLKRSS